MGEPITGLSSMATRGLLATLAASFEAGTGIAAAIRSLGGVEAARLVRAGEAADVVVLAADVMAALEREGHLRGGSGVAVVLSRMALAVPEGAPRPDIADEGGLRLAILAAPRICYSTGPSGDRLKRLLERWAIAERVADRLVQAPPGVPVGRLLAEGGGGVGVQQLSELSGVPGVTVVGTLPPALDPGTVFTAGIGARTRSAEAASAFLAHLAAPAADGPKREAGFEPP